MRAGRGPEASEARKSTAAAAPTMPSWFCVPVSSVLGRGARRRLEPRQVERVDQRLASPEHADVRAVELVGRAGQEVGAERRDVDERVRRVVDGVHEDERARGVGEVRGPRARR